MRVVQAAGWFPPFDLGGTEVYLDGLVGALRKLGVVSTAIVPRHPLAPEHYEHNGIEVRTYNVNHVPGAGELRGVQPHTDFDRFRSLLLQHRGAIYHQHSWTRGCGAHHLRAAKDLGMPTVLTVHVAGNICLRGSMLRFGRAPCDGHVDDRMCGACWGESHGLPSALARALAGLPRPVSAAVRRLPIGKVATALGARALAHDKLQGIADMVDAADRVVVVCGWLHDVLLAVGAPREKIILNRQGVSEGYLGAISAGARVRREDSSTTLRILFLGRWDPAKGIDVVVRAVAMLPPSCDVRLNVFGSKSVTDDGSYEAMVTRAANGDQRIAFGAAVGRDALADLMAEHDVLAVPSLVMETGPLVVLEAQAAGLFVLGSRLGGIAELVSDARRGTLVPPGDVTAWAAAIESLVARRKAGQLVRERRQVRTMETVADETRELYQSLRRR